MLQGLVKILEKQRAGDFRLYQNEPNPFSARTEIRFTLPKACHVRLVLYNREHELVRVLHEGPMSAGQHAIVWEGTTADGKCLAEGFYTYRLEAAGFVATRKLELSLKSQ
jgi:hypothetical protein